MSTVDFITFVCPKDIRRLHDNHEFDKRMSSHDFEFNDFHVIRQRCGNDFDDVVFTAKEHRSEDYPNILQDFGISESAKAEEMTHGPSGAHYWKWHVINHLIGLQVSTADYIVFQDCDCRMVSNGEFGDPWIPRGIDLLNHYPEILIVAPSDGGHEQVNTIYDPKGVIRLTQTVSQQMFLCDRKVLSKINFDVPWDWEFTAPGGPMAEFYYMLEGRMWRYMNKYRLFRAMLPETWRYWHDGWH